jgi:hypothetical protein
MAACMIMSEWYWYAIRRVFQGCAERSQYRTGWKIGMVFVCYTTHLACRYRVRRNPVAHRFLHTGV